MCTLVKIFDQFHMISNKSTNVSPALLYIHNYITLMIGMPSRSLSLTCIYAWYLRNDKKLFMRQNNNERTKINMLKKNLIIIKILLNWF